MTRIAYLLIILTFFSCSTGHLDNYGIYVPNYPNYSLKDKIKDSIPKELDTFNLYKYYGSYNNIALVKDTLDDANWHIYKKFSASGRVYGFGTDTLSQKNLNPKYSRKGYYIYNKRKDVIKYEMYTNGNGGQYVVLNFKLSKEGDTLTSILGKRKSHVYIKEKIPKEWKRYTCDW